MRYVLFTMTLIFLINYAVFSDHHGRGHEATSGFPGIYSTDQFTLTFTGDGHLIFAIKKTGIAVGVSKYTVTNNVLSLHAVSPPAFFNDKVKQCVSENEGSYAIVDSADNIRFEKIEDPCNGRSGLLNNLKVNKYKRPDKKAISENP